MLETVNSVLGTFLAVLLIITGFFFSLRLKLFRLLFASRRQSISKLGSEKGVSPFRALTVALAGTLGVGNIVGVATAIFLGGFGSVFWMWVSSVLAMTLKYAETVLAISHRRIGKDGKFYGGALYYIKDCLDKKGLYRTGYVLCLIFSFFLISDSFSTGGIIQINAASRSLFDAFGIRHLFTGIIFGTVVASVVLSGFGGLSKLTEILIPFLTVGFIAISVLVLFIERDNVANAFSMIFSDAFNVKSAAGGAVGFLTNRALRFGCVRGLMSNEAGCGTSPTAHASADTESPVSQGLWGMLEVFIDTIVLCTLTALVIIVNYDAAFPFGNDGIMMAIEAYRATLGDFAKYFLSVSVAFFGFATLLCRAHYGRETMRFLFPKKRSLFEKIYVIVYAAVCVFGACVSPNAVWGIADLSIEILTIINITILILMRGEVFSLTNTRRKQKTYKKR